LCSGNLLKTRKREVWLVTRESEERILLEEKDLAEGKEIEQDIVNRVKAFHLQFQQEAKQK
jgi:hypothetical protein